MSKSQRRTQSQIPIDVRDRVQNSILNQKIHQTKYLRTQFPISNRQTKTIKTTFYSSQCLLSTRQCQEEGDYASYTNWPSTRRRGPRNPVMPGIRGSTHLQIGVNRKLKRKKQMKVQDIGYSLQPVSRYCTYILKTCKSMCVIYATW